MEIEMTSVFIGVVIVYAILLNVISLMQTVGQSDFMVLMKQRGFSFTLGRKRK